MRNLIIVLFTLLNVKSYTQINIGGKPFSFSNYKTEKIIPIYSTTALDIEKLKKEDEQDELDNVPPRFGYKHDVSLNTENNGVWTTLPNGDKLWQLEIYCPKAKSINFTFDMFWLPENSVLYIYNKSRTHVIGGFTTKNNKSDDKNNPRGFATGLVYGETVILEYYQTNNDELPIISINGIVHGYRNIPEFWKTKSTSDIDDFGESGPCQIDVNCSDGDDWQDEKKGIALILVNGDRYCTGSLINNTCNDGTLYFLTANHCVNLTAPHSLDDFSFYWNYEKSDCNNPTTIEPPIYSTVGAELIARNIASDFSLLELDESPLELSMPLGVVFNGWNATNNMTSSGAGIHHPSGDVKKISLYTQTPLGDYTYCNVPNTIDNKYWYVVFEHPSGHFSSTEHGSSGSPLFDANGRIIGQLTSGLLKGFCTGGPMCYDPANDMSYYGKFSKSWNQNIFWRNQLKHWLDKCNTGDTEIDGIKWDCEDVIYVNQPLYYLPPIFTNSLIKANQSVVGSNLIQASLNIEFKAGKDVILKPNFHAVNGSNFIAKITPCNPTEFTSISSNKNYTKVENNTKPIINIDTKLNPLKNNDFIVYPNPTNSFFNIVYQSALNARINIIISDVNGKVLFYDEQSVLEGKNEIKDIDLNNYVNGIYIITIKSKESRLVKKIILKK